MKTLEEILWKKAEGIKIEKELNDDLNRTAMSMCCGKTRPRPNPIPHH